MARSESLASLCLPLWELRTGHRREMPEWHARIERDLHASPLVARILERLDEFAASWHGLPVGGGLTLSWPLNQPGNAGSDGRRRPRSTATNHDRPIPGDRAMVARRTG
jgi:hypothetical protein